LGLIQILVSAVVQGITEVLPVSSSGHSLLLRRLTGWPPAGGAIDVAMHVGFLIAVLAYFWRDVWRMILGLVRIANGRRDRGASLVGALAVGTIPTLIVGWFVAHYAGNAFRDVAVVGWTMIGFAVLMWLADRFGLTILRLEHLRPGHAIIIGLCQCLAFLPGASRSGITIVAARLLSFERADAARFSFLLSLPSVGAATIWQALRLSEQGALGSLRDAAVAAGATAVMAFLALAVLMAWLRRRSFTPFVVYRLIVGGLLLAVVYLQAPLR
jgi:undecaprenyl-diphosphatase